jgi:hypothetical protein
LDIREDHRETLNDLFIKTLKKESSAMRAKTTSSALFALLLGFALTACTDSIINTDVQRSEAGSGFYTMTTDIIENPHVFTDNFGGAAAECQAIADHFGIDGFMYSYKWNEDGEIDDSIDQESPNGSWTVNGNTITILNSDGDYFDFMATSPIGGVYAKGGPGGHGYFYSPQVLSAEGLSAPVNPNNSRVYGTSHVTFCWNPENVEKCYRGETAWSAGERYTQRGNWATYTGYEDGLEVTLFAGRTHEAGSVSFEAVEDDSVKITISLNEGWSLKVADEPVKIQGYEAAPSGNPAPGLFTTYKGDELEITVPAYAFYGIHLDVREEIECTVD